MNITLAQACHILTVPNLIQIDGYLASRCLSDLRDREDVDNVFLTLQWEDDEGRTFEANFRQGDQDDTVRVDGSSLWLQEDGGDLVELTILAPAKLT